MEGTVLLFFMCVGLVLSQNQNMNGDYVVASGGNQNVPFNTDYASKGNEYFDVYSPEIATHYGDVFWMDQGLQPLPDDIVKRFAGKVIAITGYEQDQVMVQPQGEPGVNPELDVSVPINWAYNHHYMTWMVGNYSALKKVPIHSITDRYSYNHGGKYQIIAVDLPGSELRSDPNIPTSQFFSEGNGGESRKSFHGYPNKYAQLVESPESWHITPMQIDTRNRECGVTPNDINNCTKFIPGDEPIQTRYGRGIPKNTNYSGLLECPCNGKFGGDPLFYGSNTLTKTVVHNYVTLQSLQCAPSQKIISPKTCFAAVMNIMGDLYVNDIINKTVSDTSMPTGCTVMKNINNNQIYAIYNSLTVTNQSCSTSNRMSGITESAVNVTVQLSIDTTVGNITFIRSPPGEYCSDNHDGILAKFPTQSSSNQDALKALTQCENYCKKNSKCEVCSVDCAFSTMEDNGGQCQWNALPKCGIVLSFNGPSGVIPGDISRKSQGLVNITVSGPSDVWFGVGFNATVMADSPYALIINSSGVIEQHIGTCGSEAEHCPGNQLNNTVTLLSNTVNGNVRTVHMQRNLIGLTTEYYSFIPSDAATIPLITAIGQTQVFAYHKAHAPTVISLIMSSGNTCVCDTGANGKICQPDGTECKSFVKGCVPPPNADLLAQNNPTCNSKQYSGGLSCCRNKKNLLDANQTIPDPLLRYHMKFRFWYQEYSNISGNVSHYNLPRIYQQTEANAGEYDVPPAFALPNIPVVGYEDWPLNKTTPGTSCTGNCPDGDDCECIHEITLRWIPSPNRPLRLIYAGGHCHAPSCISLNLYRNDTGEMLCSQIPIYGQGNVKENKYDEAGYILIPPCLWGNDTGLNPSVLLPAGTPLHSIKKNRNTHMGHYGEMASWQMRGVFF